MVGVLPVESEVKGIRTYAGQWNLKGKTLEKMDSWEEELRV